MSTFNIELTAPLGLNAEVGVALSANVPLSRRLFFAAEGLAAGLPPLRDSSQPPAVLATLFVAAQCIETSLKALIAHAWADDERRYAAQITSVATVRHNLEELWRIANPGEAIPASVQWLTPFHSAPYELRYGFKDGALRFVPDVCGAAEQLLTQARTRLNV